MGCGDVGLRVLALLRPRVQVVALTSSPARMPALRAAGALPVAGNLDEPASLRRLAQWAAVCGPVLHLAPPPGEGVHDTRTRHLLQALARAAAGARTPAAGARRLVYAGTTGVYGDAGGAWLDESGPQRPRNPRALRRVDAERQLRAAGRCGQLAPVLLRIPGIYALDRPGGHPRERLLRGAPVLRAEDDVHTNHIHADDLARACVAALRRGRPQRAVNACDGSDLAMGDYFDLAADLLGLPRPPRISRAEAQTQLSPMQLSFMAESRRLHNRRLVQELRLALWHPDVREGLMAPGRLLAHPVDHPLDRDASPSGGRPQGLRSRSSGAASSSGRR